MYGDRAEEKMPRKVRKLLEEYGGFTPSGLIMWRLVKAGDCMILCQGKVHHFAKGVDFSIEDPESIRPVRISNGVASMPRYRDIDPEWWILQKWFPPSTWGFEAQWQMHRTEDVDTRLFVQEFPRNGDYFLLAGPWPSIREAGDLTAPIRAWMRAELTKERDAENLVREWMADEIAQRMHRVEWLEKEISRYEDAAAETLKTIGADAQAVRDQIAARAGVTGHLGASEGWG